MQVQYYGNTRLFVPAAPQRDTTALSEEALFQFLYRYDWTKGFDVPWEVINSPLCDMSTALLAFDLADGYAIFDHKQVFHQEWSEFVYELYNRIRLRDFLPPVYAYQPAVTRDLFVALRKTRPDIDPIFLYGTAGKDIDLATLE